MTAILYGTYNYFFPTSPCVDYDKLISRQPISNEEGTMVCIPKRALKPGSVVLVAKKTHFEDWSEKEHAAGYNYLQRISTIWKENNRASQFLIYGRDDLTSLSQFRWEMVPYENTSGAVSRLWQQFQVLWSITFGPSDNSALQQEEIAFYEQKFKSHKAAPKNEDAVQGNDPFCKEEVIRKQRVLEGKKVDVLYNYAPIGFGGERLHFLFVPKQHRKDFTELSQEEYTEASQLAAKVIGVFKNENQDRIAYLFHKTGKDAGQTVEHWHLHLVITSNPAEDLLGKCKVLWNMLFGSAPLKDEELRDKVERYRKKLV